MTLRKVLKPHLWWWNLVQQWSWRWVRKRKLCQRFRRNVTFKHQTANKSYTFQVKFRMQSASIQWKWSTHSKFKRRGKTKRVDRTLLRSIRASRWYNCSRFTAEITAKMSRITLKMVPYESINQCRKIQLRLEVTCSRATLFKDQIVFLRHDSPSNQATVSWASSRTLLQTSKRIAHRWRSCLPYLQINKLSCKRSKS